MDKYKIQIISRSSPQKSTLAHNQNNTNIHHYTTYSNRQKMYRHPLYQQYQDGVLYSRSPSTFNNHELQENVINLREKIVNPKQCFVRPSSQKERESKLFTDKCLDILSKKKHNSKISQHQSRMHAMMTHVVEKYKKVVSSNKYEHQKKSAADRNLTQPKTLAGYSQINGFEDKIQVYRMIRSTQVPKSIGGEQKINLKEQMKNKQKLIFDWRSKPDVTGVRMNNRIIKSQSHNFKGVQCFSLAISQIPLTKRQSLILSNQVMTAYPVQNRTTSSNSTRKKISINRINTNKFMAFSLNTDADALYMKKLKSFLDFIFKINYSNKIYVSLQLSQDLNNIKKYKVYIGKGNNSLLIKSLLKRRFWLQIVQDPQQEGINFFWTQNKINKQHYKQTISKTIKINKQQKQNAKRKQNFKDSDQKQTFELNKKILPNQQCYNIQSYICKDGYFMPQQQKYSCPIITNHIPGNTSIGSKKNLFKSLFHYYKQYMKTDPFDYIPKTFNVKGPEDPQYKRFLRQYENQPRKVWIVKPGENSNRGNGIKLAQTSKVVDLIRRKQKHANGQTKTYILQSYIQRPFLYNGRKFDIRHYMMITSVNGIIKAYWYKQGYIRTSSQKYDISDLSNQQIHLTNDAIQKKYQQYQKHQPGNKLSYPEFQRYLDLTYPNRGYNFQRDIVAKMRCIMVDVIKANFNVMDRGRRECNFEIFGFDFMVDREFRPWLIEVNFNPCLEINCPVLSRIIPIMVQNSLRVGLDPLLPPMNHYPGNKRFTLTDNFLKNLKYELMFDELTFNQTIPIYHQIQDSDDQQEQYNDDGKEIQELII